MKVFLSYATYKVSKEKQIERREFLTQVAKVIFGEDVKCIDNSNAIGPADVGRLYCLGMSIRKIDTCDCVIFDHDWEHYLECDVCHDIAERGYVEYIDLDDSCIHRNDGVALYVIRLEGEEECGYYIYENGVFRKI